MNPYRDITTEIIEALTKMGGRAPLWHIAYEIRQTRRARGDDIPESIDLSVRRTLEERCAKSCFYRGVSDLFVVADDGGYGIWSINHAEAERQRRLTYYPRAY